MPSIDTFTYLDPSKDRRVAIITGGNSGIGFYTVLQLYLHGYIIYIAGRSRSRCNKSINELKAKAIEIIDAKFSNSNTNIKNNDEIIEFNKLKNRQLGELHYLELDLSNLQSVLKAVETFKQKEEYLHLLINNAGAMAVPYTLTQDNYEVQLQTNFISPFLLTLKLLPILEKTKDQFPNLIENPRVIYLSSIGHQFASLYFNLKKQMNYKPDFIFTWVRYGIAKTAGIHFMKMIALRNPKVLCIIVHPGFVMNPNIFTYWTNLPIVGILFWCFFQIFAYFFGVTPEQGADEVTKESLNSNFTIEKNNGESFGPGGKIIQPSKVASNMDYAARTWIWTIRELNERGVVVD
ncbi:uncharacterized protein KGF55_001713 [Candida pseudojiufengensis]|uniref:uncharacterized protein n=1 Tax=Candida pseudojiufengensis TaxID=497109 RepID=UPI0022241BF8|nr:uncharacterized protein KGF55_001713 [Candida pseudojiufengensis]KAI5964644.1 hypothetical protein KGF55_001713 [Candida pseudojiufengensis]